MKSLDDVAERVTAEFERLGRSYALMGGLAVRVYAIPRPTFDLDFTLAIDRASLPGLHDAMENMGFVVPPVLRSGWVDMVAQMPVVKYQWLVATRSIDVDLFLAETPLQQSLLDRRRRLQAKGFLAWFASPEDVILMKLLAFRPKDKVDIQDIRFIQGDIDERYIDDWCRRLDLVDRWAEVRQSS